LKGFKKDGKFRPTEKRSKSALKKSDIGRQGIQTKKYIPIEKRSKHSFQCTGCDTEFLDKSQADRHIEKYPKHKIIRWNRNKETIGHHGNTEIIRGDDGLLYEKEKGGTEHRLYKFSLFGDKKSDQAKASEERIKNQEHEQKVLQKQDQTQDKNNQKRAKEIAKHIKFLERHMEGLEKKPAKFGVNASTQLENLQESRDQKRDLQAELDEINKLLEHPQVRHKRGAKPFTNLQHKQERSDYENVQANEYQPIRDKNTLKGVSETELHDALGHAGIDPSGAIGNYPKSHLRGIVEDYRKSMNEPRAKVVKFQ